MTNLYRRNGTAPAALPSIAYDEAGNAFTPPYADDDLAALGFAIAPPKPDDTETQTAEWDAEAEAWVMVDRPPPPPEPEPDPRDTWIPVDVMRERAEALGIWSPLAAYLAQNPELMLKVLTLTSGKVNPEDPDLLAGLEACEVPPQAQAVLLAPMA